MISSFFSRSKPIHFVVVSLYLLLVFTLVKFYNLPENIGVQWVLEQLGLFVVALGSLFVFDFFVGKNNLTQKNGYRILIYALFVGLFPEVFLDGKLLIANFFVLLAMRRIISLGSQKDMKKKLFDAALWISLASLLFFWTSIFFSLIFVALFLYSVESVKNWIIPFVGVFCVAIIGLSVMIVADINIQEYFMGFTETSFDFSDLNTKRLIISTTLFLTYSVWTSIYYLTNIKTKIRSHRPTYVLIAISALIALSLMIIAPEKDGSEFIFAFAPLAIIVSNYLETIPEKWFKETLILGLVLVPILALLL